MPKMVLKQESRLNGVKTNIFNLDEIAKALRVPEEGKNHKALTHIIINVAVSSLILESMRFAVGVAESLFPI